MEPYYSCLSCNLMDGDCRKMLRALVLILNAFLALYLGHQENLQAFLRKYSDFVFSQGHFYLTTTDCYRLFVPQKSRFKSLEFFKKYGNPQPSFPGWEKVVRQVSKQLKSLKLFSAKIA